jgi:tetratricopeptide (TPR) repeat protein
MLEIGDIYSMGAWVHYELGDYAEALRIVEPGVERVAGRGPSVELHTRSWRAAAQYRLGAWDESLLEVALIDGMLDEDRRASPPYFVAHAFALAATIHEARGDRIQSDRAAALLTTLHTSFAGRLHPFLVRLLVERGDLETARTRLRPSNWRVHAADSYEADAELLAAEGAWQRAPALLAEMRTHALQAPSPSVSAFADRLEGRAALAAGEADRAIPLLEAARAVFADRQVPWERGLSDLDLARAHTQLGRRDAARATLTSALEAFEALRAARDVARARAALSELG